MKNIVTALAGLVLFSSCVFAPGDKECDCKHPKMHQGPKKGFKKPEQFKGPKNVSEMKHHKD